MTKSSDHGKAISFEDMAALYIISRNLRKHPYLIQKSEGEKGDVDRIIKFTDNTEFRAQIKSNQDPMRLTCARAKEGFNQLFSDFKNTPPEYIQNLTWLIAWEGTLDPIKVKPLSFVEKGPQFEARLTFLNEMEVFEDQDAKRFMNYFAIQDLPPRNHLEHMLETLWGKDAIARAYYKLEKEGILTENDEEWPSFTNIPDQDHPRKSVFQSIQQKPAQLVSEQVALSIDDYYHNQLVFPSPCENGHEMGDLHCYLWTLRDNEAWLQANGFTPEFFNLYGHHDLLITDEQRKAICESLKHDMVSPKEKVPFKDLMDAIKIPRDIFIPTATPEDPTLKSLRYDFDSKRNTGKGFEFDSMASVYVRVVENNRVAHYNSADPEDYDEVDAKELDGISY